MRIIYGDSHAAASFRERTHVDVAFIEKGALFIADARCYYLAAKICDRTAVSSTCSKVAWNNPEHAKRILIQGANYCCTVLPHHEA